jgi:hypothetical protein
MIKPAICAFHEKAPVASEHVVRLTILTLTLLRYYIHRTLILILRTIISALIIVKKNPFLTQLLFADLILYDQVLDRMLLPTIYPAGETEQEYMP